MDRAMAITKYENCFIGWMDGHMVIMPNVKRVTVKRRADMVRILADKANRKLTAEIANNDAYLAKHSTKYAGRYDYCEIHTYDNNTYSFSTTASSGGDFDMAMLTIVD